MTRARAACAVVALTLCAVVALIAAPSQGQASASAPHRAAVVVDLGDGHVKVGCVSFTEDHLSGLEALDRASMAPVAQTYGGQGSAVCALCGKGCTAGSTCLTCKAPNYWAYYHDGIYSSAGAGQSQVRDGDIEGWKWGKGERPAQVPFDQVCPVSAGPSPTPSPSVAPIAPVVPVAPRTKPTTPAPPTTAGPIGGGNGGRSDVTPTNPSVSGPAPSATGPGVRTTNARTPTTAVSSTAPAHPSTTAPTSSVPATGPSSAGKQPNAHEKSAAIGRKHIVVERAGADTRASVVASDKKGNTSQWSIAAFLGVLAIMAGLITFFRRRRAATG